MDERRWQRRAERQSRSDRFALVRWQNVATRDKHWASILAADSAHGSGQAMQRETSKQPIVRLVQRVTERVPALIARLRLESVLWSRPRLRRTPASVAVLPRYEAAATDK